MEALSCEAKAVRLVFPNADSPFSRLETGALSEVGYPLHFRNCMGMVPETGLVMAIIDCDPGCWNLFRYTILLWFFKIQMELDQWTDAFGLSPGDGKFCHVQTGCQEPSILAGE